MAIMIVAKPVGPVVLKSVRKEVRDFIEAAEILLSPALLTSELTADECDLIKEYIMTMSHAKHPWTSS